MAIGREEGLDKEIGQRIQKSDEAMRRLQKIWQLRTLTLEEKIELYKALVRTILEFGMETRDIWGQQLLRLEICQMRHLRRLAKRPYHIQGMQ